MKFLNGWAYVSATDDKGNFCVYRFHTKYWGRKEVPFQVLFTWKIDWGIRND